MKTSSDSTLVDISVQRACEHPGVPEDEQFKHWVSLALGPERAGAAVCIRLVDEDEGRTLNLKWRERDQATNVLSFPAELPEGAGIDFIGDLVLCVPVIEREAQEQGKPLFDHWAHLVIHGVLHLRGFDHISEQQAKQMEAREIELLAGLGIPDPYAGESN